MNELIMFEERSTTPFNRQSRKFPRCYAYFL